MTPLRLIILSLSLTLTAACATQSAGEIPGLSQFKDPCPNEPPVLTDEEARAMGETMSAEDRERTFWAPNALALRRCVLFERARAESLLAAGEAFNEAVRNSN